MIENTMIPDSVIIRHRHLVNIYNSHIGPYTKIASFVEIGGAKIGAHCKIQAFAFIPPGTVIEDCVFIGSHVTICNDKNMVLKGEWKLSPVIIKEGAKIGAGAIILPGVTIGKYAIVGAGSVLTKDVPPREVWFGNPARRRK